MPAVVHMSFFIENSHLHHFDTWPWLLGCLFYLVGAVIYAFNWPERYWIAKFDYVGNSHNIFHVMIVMAALIHWFGAVRLFHERQLY
jgi:predicted membrane channel-forming protein YqfA (hemolysin III family)